MPIYEAEVRLPFGTDKVPDINTFRQMAPFGGEVTLVRATHFSGSIRIGVADDGASAEVTFEFPTLAGAEDPFMDILTLETEGGILTQSLVTDGTTLIVGRGDSLAGVFWPSNVIPSEFMKNNVANPDLNSRRLHCCVQISGLRPTDSIVGSGTQDDAL